MSVIIENNFSNHAIKRSQQRGIRPWVVNFIAEYSDKYKHANESCIAQFISKRKVKKLIQSKLTNLDIRPVSFGNLNVWLDIGFAPDFMEALGDLISAQFRPLEITIGTGKYSHLKLLCDSILEDYQISFDKYVTFDDSFDRPTFYPLMPSSFIGQHSLLDSSKRMLNNGPSPLTPQMLRSEDHAFKVN